MKTNQIDLATAQRWYESNNEELKALAVQTYPEIENKVDSWEDLGVIGGWYVSMMSEVFTSGCKTEMCNRNVFHTREQAKASIAMAQLSQLIARANGNWKADWKSCQEKFCIGFNENEPMIFNYNSHKRFLAFPNLETAKTFLEKHRELILKAEPLL